MVQCLEMFGLASNTLCDELMYSLVFLNLHSVMCFTIGKHAVQMGEHNKAEGIDGKDTV